jgi:hypothetical protein
LKRIALALVIWAFTSAAKAATGAPLLDGTVRIVARVQPDLQTIEGTITLPEQSELRLVDVLARLPKPITDLAAQRTWPSVEETGWINMGAPRKDGQQDFLSIIPRRYGASGMVPGQGLFIHGLWHPQPVLTQRVPITRWEVELHLPPGTLGVLNNTVGEGVLRWSGLADRLSLAVIPQGRARRIQTPGQTLIVVDDGAHNNRRMALLAEAIPEEWPLVGGEPIVVVMAPMYRRLARPGPGMVFLSQRATRLSLGLWRHHIDAIRRGILTAGVLNADPWARGLAASHMTQRLPPGPSASETLSWLAWIPDVDAILYDGSLPFNSEVMGALWPGDPVADDLLEIIENVTPSQVALHKIAGLAGWAETARMVEGIAKGQSIDIAAETAGVPSDVLEQWRKMPPEQNLLLRHQANPAGGSRLSIVRQTDPGAPPESVQIQIDGHTRSWITRAGPDDKTITLAEEPQVVQVDPDLEVKQTRRDDDGWPPRWTPTLALGLSEFRLGQSRPTASLHTWLRRRYGTRWVYGAHVGTNPVDLVSGAVSISRSLGPLINKRSRPVLVWLSVGGGLLDSDFRPTDQGRTAIDTSLGAAWDTRDAWPLPRRGHRMASSLGLGWVPQGEQRWTLWQAVGSRVMPIAPRVVVAARGSGGVSLGGIPHRLRSLGGTGGVQGIRTDAVLGHTTTTASVELRALPLRRASIPLLLAWGSDLQLSGGLDAGAAWTDDGRAHAVGWSAGLAGVAHLLGARPALAGIWFAAPLQALSSGIPQSDGTQVYLRFAQAM